MAAAGHHCGIKDQRPVVSENLSVTISCGRGHTDQWLLACGCTTPCISLVSAKETFSDRAFFILLLLHVPVPHSSSVERLIHSLLCPELNPIQHFSVKLEHQLKSVTRFQDENVPELKFCCSDQTIFLQNFRF